MTINIDTEYEALREEMNHRIEMIHQTCIYAMAVTLGVIGFGLTDLRENAGIGKAQIAALIQVFLLLLVLYIREQYSVLYRIGTYIAFQYEGSERLAVRWHRMSRHFDAWLKECRKPPRPMPRWGGGTKLGGWMFLCLTAANIVALVFPETELTFRPWEAINTQTLAVLLALLTLWYARPLLHGGLRPLIDRLTSEWGEYHAKFEHSSFASRYLETHEQLRPTGATASQPGTDVGDVQRGNQE